MDNLAASLDTEIEGEGIKSYALTLASAAVKRLSHNLNPVQAQMIAGDILILRATHGPDLATRCITILSTDDLEKRL